MIFLNGFFPHTQERTRAVLSQLAGRSLLSHRLVVMVLFTIQYRNVGALPKIAALTLHLRVITDVVFHPLKALDKVKHSQTA